VSFGLEVFGDTWSLLIVRDIAFFGKQTFREFLASDEGIATNILKARLVHLEDNGIISRRPHPSDRRKELYSLTKKGEDLLPIVDKIVGWSDTYQANENVRPSPKWVSDARLTRSI
jgi:DNA-binding HxlR family transcriptional regulator